MHEIQAAGGILEILVLNTKCPYFCVGNDVLDASRSVDAGGCCVFPALPFVFVNVFYFLSGALDHFLDLKS